MMHMGILNMKSAHINAVKPQYRQYRRETARGPARGEFKDFRQAQCIGEYGAGFFVPVVKIAGDHQWRVVRNHFPDAIVQCPELCMPAAFEQSKVDTNAMQVIFPLRNADFTMQQAAAFETVC